MSKPYPLYDDLLSKVNTGSFDVKKVCTTINEMPNYMSTEEYSKHYQEITALIFHHELKTTGALLSSVAYDGKVMAGGKGILYNITSLPPILQQIISIYIDHNCVKS